VKPSAVVFSPDLESIGARLRKEVRFPGIVPDETELPATEGAALRCRMLKVLRMIEHFHLL
jgi:hypothetical protein